MVDLEAIILSEATKAQRDKHHMLPLTCRYYILSFRYKCLRVTIAVVKHHYWSNLGSNGFIWLTIPYPSSSLKEVRTGQEPVVSWCRTSSCPRRQKHHEGLWTLKHPKLEQLVTSDSCKILGFLSPNWNWLAHWRGALSLKNKQWEED